MSKPLDLKTVKIFEPLKKKPSFERGFSVGENPVQKQLGLTTFSRAEKT